jgi:nitrite reductase (NADH) large subunit
MTYLIIGCSAAGLNAATAIRKADGNGEILLLTREHAGHYSRPLLSYYLAGKIDEEGLLYGGDDYLDGIRATLLSGKDVARLDVHAHEAICADGSVFPYDRLLIACGGVAEQPDIPGIDLIGVFHFRTLVDTRAISATIERARVCVTLGGGLVSLKAAEALRERGVEEVHLIVGSHRVMSQAIDAGGAALVTKRLSENGVHTHTGESVEAVLGEDSPGSQDRRVCGVSLRGGQTLDCQMVLIGKGVRPDLSLARGAGIDTDWGILVDERMRTSVSGIYAAGDVAQAHDALHAEARVNALWPLAAQQGSVAGSNMAGRDVIYPGWFAMNSIQVFGLPVVTMGLVTARQDNDLEVLTHVDERREIYRKLVLREGRLVGCAIVGDTDASCLVGLARSRVDVSSFKEELVLRGLTDYRNAVTLRT